MPYNVTQPLLPEAVLAQQIKVLRSERGWSQQDLAQHMSNEYGLKWHQTTVAKIEAGSRPIGLNEAAALASAFQITGAQLLQPLAAHRDALEQVRSRERELAAMADHASAELAHREHDVAAAYAQADTLADEQGVISKQLEEAERELHQAAKRVEDISCRHIELTHRLHQARAIATAAQQDLAVSRDRRLYIQRELEDVRRLGADALGVARQLSVESLDEEAYIVAIARVLQALETYDQHSEDADGPNGSQTPDIEFVRQLMSAIRHPNEDGPTTDVEAFRLLTAVVTRHLSGFPHVDHLAAQSPVPPAIESARQGS